MSLDFNGLDKLPSLDLPTLSELAGDPAILIPDQLRVSTAPRPLCLLTGAVSLTRRSRRIVGSSARLSSTVPSAAQISCKCTRARYLIPEDTSLKGVSAGLGEETAGGEDSSQPLVAMPSQISVTTGIDVPAEATAALEPQPSSNPRLRGLRPRSAGQSRASAAAAAFTPESDSQASEPQQRSPRPSPDPSPQVVRHLHANPVLMKSSGICASLAAPEMADDA